MDQESQSKSKPYNNLKLTSETFGKFSWNSLLPDLKMPTNPPSPRFLHTCSTVGGKLYVLGGANSQGPLKESKIHVMDLDTLTWFTQEGKDYCEGRNGHSSATLSSQIYFFGGNSGNQLNNDLFRYSPKYNNWTLLQPEQSYPPPSPREQSLMIPINHNTFLLYGGINILSDILFDDAFLYHNQRWDTLTVKDNLSPRIKIKHSVCGRRSYVFGGQGPSVNNSLFYNDLHEVVVDEVLKEMTFKELAVSGAKPPGRTSHGMAGLSQHLLVVYGGEGIQAISQPTILNDIWIFNLQQLLWLQVECSLGKMSQRFQFSTAVLNSQIFVFGGFDKDNMMTNNLTKLQYAPLEPKSQTLCPKCVYQLEQVSSLGSTREVAMSGGFIHSLALGISFPFQAIDLIIDFSLALASTNIDINSVKNKQGYELLLFRFNGQQYLSKQFFIDFGNNEQQSSTLSYLQLGALRLGKTMLYISCDGLTRKVFLMSVDSKITGNFEESSGVVSYCEDIRSGEVMPGNGKICKQIIYNILLSQFQDPFTILSLKEGHLLIVLQLNILPTVQKAYYYELISYSRPDHDIRIYYSQKKGEMLDKIGISLSNSAQFSLKHYLQISRLSRSVKITIDHSEPIPLLHYQGLLEKYQNFGLIERLQCQLEERQYVVKCTIFRCCEAGQLQYSQGILIYCGNYLIERFRCPFGQLISNKFFKKKYKKSDGSKNTFEYIGVIQVSKELGINLTRTKARDSWKYSRVIEELTTFLKGQRRKQIDQNSDLSVLYELKFSLGREATKKHRKE